MVQKIDENTQYLAFSLRGEEYAVVITKVKEVLDVGVMTKIPRMPSYLCGVINLRGNVVPVVDLGLRLGMTEVEYTVDTCIMILEILVPGEESTVLMGAVTDSVKTVLEISPENVEPPPRMGIKIQTNFIQAMAKIDERFMILLNIDEVLTAEGEALLADGNLVVNSDDIEISSDEQL